MKPLLYLLIVTLLSACVQQPTRVTETTDDRPRLTFDVVALQERPKRYEVFVDNISYGRLDQYLTGQNTLPVISGRHRIDVKHGERVVLSEEIVLDANTTRTLRVVDR